MKYEILATNKFKKDLKAIEKRNLNTDLLKNVITKLAMGETLPENNHDHLLSGNFSGYRECHIAPDWLLIYKISERVLVLTLVRTGSHSDLF